MPPGKIALLQSPPARRGLEGSTGVALVLGEAVLRRLAQVGDVDVDCSSSRDVLVTRPKAVLG